MKNVELSKQCIIDIKQLYKKFIFNSKKERVTHFPKPYNRSGKSPYPFDKIVGKIAKDICGEKEFLKKYEKLHQMQKLLDFIKDIFYKR